MPIGVEFVRMHTLQLPAVNVRKCIVQEWVHEGGLFKRDGEVLLGQIERVTCTSTIVNSANRAQGSAETAILSGGANAGAQQLSTPSCWGCSGASPPAPYLVVRSANGGLVVLVRTGRLPLTLDYVCPAHV